MKYLSFLNQNTDFSCQMIFRFLLYSENTVISTGANPQVSLLQIVAHECLLNSKVVIIDITGPDDCLRDLNWKCMITSYLCMLALVISVRSVLFLATHANITASVLTLGPRALVRISASLRNLGERGGFKNASSIHWSA